MSRSRYYLAALGVLLVAAMFRLVALTEAPPGMIHDEVWNRANIELVYQGHIAPYYPVGAGREGLYIWVQAASVALVGENIPAMKLPSLAAGMLLVALVIALGARLFSREVGLWSGLALACSFWSVLYSRLAVRTITLAPAMALGVYVLYRALHAPMYGQRRGWFTAAGFSLGLTLYTYPGSWGLPLFLGPLVLYLAGCERARMRGRWRGLALALGLVALLVVPLVAYLEAHPEIRGRAEQVNAPMEAALAGDFGPLLANIPLVLSMFTVEGDHGLEYNLQWRPVFPEPLMSLLLYLGVALALWRMVRPGERRLAYMMLWLASFAMLAPTLITEDARNPSRPIGLLATLFLFVGIGSAWLRRGMRARWGRVGARGAAAFLALAFALNIGLTAWDFFERWRSNPVVAFLYQEDLYQIARALDRSPGLVSDQVAVSGLTPDWVDPTSLRLFMARDDVAPGCFDGQSALLLPRERPAHIFAPASMSIHPTLAAMLGEAAEQTEDFRRWTFGALPDPPDYTMQPLDAPGPLADLRALYWDGLRAGAPAHLLSYWATHAPSAARLRVFVHLTDEDQRQVYTQDDGLGVPSLQWRAGESFYQTHTLELPAELPAGAYLLRVGLYAYEPAGGRILFDDGADAVSIPVTVGP